MQSQGSSPRPLLTPRDSEMDLCGTCKKEVAESDHAMECDLCEAWKYIACLREADQPDEELYQPLVRSRSKNIVYVCSGCRKWGSIFKRLCKLEMESECLASEQLASMHVVDERDELIRTLHTENDQLQTKLASLEDKLWQLTTKALDGNDVRQARLVDNLVTPTHEPPAVTQGGEDEEEGGSVRRPGAAG